MENKREITTALTEVLKLTTQFENLEKLEYSDFGTMEMVTATFKGGFTKRANVSMDSGTALIVDVIRQLS